VFTSPRALAIRVVVTGSTAQAFLSGRFLTRWKSRVSRCWLFASRLGGSVLVRFRVFLSSDKNDPRNHTKQREIATIPASCISWIDLPGKAQSLKVRHYRLGTHRPVGITRQFSV